MTKIDNIDGLINDLKTEFEDLSDLSKSELIETANTLKELADKIELRLRF